MNIFEEIILNYFFGDPSDMRSYYGEDYDGDDISEYDDD